MKDFRNDDMQNFVLMICNFFEIDDIHGFAVILFSEVCIIFRRLLIASRITAKEISK